MSVYDDIVKAIFEDEECLNSMCDLVKGMFELQHARDIAADKMLDRIYGYKED